MTMGLEEDILEAVRKIYGLFFWERRSPCDELEAVGNALASLLAALQQLRDFAPADPAHDFIVAQIAYGFREYLEQLRQDLNRLFKTVSQQPSPRIADIVSPAAIQDVVHSLGYFAFSFNTLAFAFSKYDFPSVILTPPDTILQEMRRGA